jgi:hypothetical protein
MSYLKAKECFEENIKKYLDPRTDPVLYNLNVGLVHLAQQLQLDHRKLEQHLRHLEDELRHVRIALRT